MQEVPALTDLGVDALNRRQQIASVHLSEAPEARGEQRNFSFRRADLGRPWRRDQRRRAVVRVLLGGVLPVWLLAASAHPVAADTTLPEPQLLRAVAGVSPAPALALPRLDGGTFDGAGAHGTLVVHFFATWCEPCRTELPALGRFAARHPDISVLLVDVAEPEIRARRFFGELAPPGTVLLDRDRAAARAWGVSLLPATFVVKAGALRLAAEGEVAWDAAENDALIQPLRTSAARGEAPPQISPVPIKTEEEQ